MSFITELFAYLLTVQFNFRVSQSTRSYQKVRIQMLPKNELDTQSFAVNAAYS